MKIKKKDSLNQTKIKKIIKKYGFLGKDEVGNKGNLALFLVIQHSPLNEQIKYLPILQKAFNKGKISEKDFAYFEDRISRETGIKQKYGTQLSFDEDLKLNYFDLNTIRDIKNLDKYRIEVGLEPIKEYLEHWRIIWVEGVQKLYSEAN